jgi:hypothetical protein
MAQRYRLLVTVPDDVRLWLRRTANLTGQGY